MAQSRSRRRQRVRDRRAREGDALGLVSPQLGRSSGRREHLHIGAQHLGRLSARRVAAARSSGASAAPKSSFKMGPGTRTAWQHDGRILPDGGVTFFDNGSNPPIHRESRAMRIALDFKTHEARLRSAYTHPSPLLSISQGNMQTLPDGNAVVDYGGVPEISEYAKAGSLLFDAHLPLEMDTYRGFRFPWSGRPADPTDGARQPEQHERRDDRAHELERRDRRNLLARARRGTSQALEPRSTIPASDFESSTMLPKKYALRGGPSAQLGRPRAGRLATHRSPPTPASVSATARPPSGCEDGDWVSRGPRFGGRLCGGCVVRCLASWRSCCRSSASRSEPLVALPPHPATVTVAGDRSASSVSMAASDVRFIGRFPLVAHGFEGPQAPPYQALATPLPRARDRRFSHRPAMPPPRDFWQSPSGTSTTPR